MFDLKKFRDSASSNEQSHNAFVVTLGSRMLQAADEIDRLRVERDAWKDAAEEMCKQAEAVAELLKEKSCHP